MPRYRQVYSAQQVEHIINQIAIIWLYGLVLFSRCIISSNAI